MSFHVDYDMAGYSHPEDSQHDATEVSTADEIAVLPLPTDQDISVEDTVRIHAKTVHGTLAAMDLSWSINKQSPWYASIYGTQGEDAIASSDAIQQAYESLRKDDWIVLNSLARIIRNPMRKRGIARNSLAYASGYESSMLC